MPTQFPYWFDHSLMDIYNKKRDRSKIGMLDRTLDALMRTALKTMPSDYVDTRKNTWEDIEDMIVVGCTRLKRQYQPDMIVGIKSGGAFIANYVAECLGVEDIDYMRTSHYSDNARGVARSLTEVNKNAIVSESVSGNAEGRLALLVDDQTATGSSLMVARQHLLELGAADVRTFCLYSQHEGLVDFFVKKGLGVYFPWGKDA